jgi:hypothetical protein
MTVREKLACLVFASTERVYTLVYSDDKDDEIFDLMDDPKQLLKKLADIGREYGVDHCNSSFEEEGYYVWLTAVQDARNWARFGFEKN